MSIQIGVYICHCGVNIAGKVRVEEVAAFARKLRHVAVARDYKFMCSDPGQELIERDIREYGLNRVVVASCSPRLHEKTFQQTCLRAGLNPYLLQMASVREQVSWVTADSGDATRKAKTLVAGAVNRVVHHERLTTREVSVHPEILVVGGGIAGMQAALDIADGGYPVHLVEQSSTIGGHMLQFDKTFPTLDCAACIGTPKMVQVAQHPHIHLHTYSRVKEVSGYVGNYTTTIEEKPRYVDATRCTGCGECEKVCPVSVKSEWNEGMSERKAIYRAFPQAVPITFCIDKRDRAPCLDACPAHTNVQGYVQLIKQGKYPEAVRLIMERIPLPGTLGRICPHPCEAACRRQEIDEAVAIRELKRFASDQVDFEALPIPKIEEIDQKVAVVGSGPSGLTVAYDLRLLGYKVTLFEALPQLGGMLRMGIPDYRLPPAVLDREIGYILRLGVEVRKAMRFGKDFALADLSREGFSSVFLGIGAHRSIQAGIQGEADTRGVTDAIRFLHIVNAGGRVEIGRRVVVVGGGNVAVDAVRVARRLGAEQPVLIYRRTEKEMPAYAEEIERAREENIELRFLTAPVQVLRQDGWVTGLECIRTELGPPDDSGRQRPVPVAGSEYTIPCDTVILAIGQRVDWSEVLKEDRPACSRSQFIQVERQTMQTSFSQVFAGGDAAGGPATAVEAIADGHRAAKSIHAFLQGELSENFLDSPVEAAKKNWPDPPEDEVVKPRLRPVVKPADRRVSGFEEEEAAFSENEALDESGRCLNCGVCSECNACVAACEANAIHHGMKSREVDIKSGAIVVATGYDLMDPAPLRQYGYKRYPNVFSSLEFERLSNATGPTGGSILLRDEKGRFTRPPESVAILHCVGSRDDRYHEYCSRVCCMYALKYGHLIHDKVGHHASVYNFYIDMRCFGKGYEEFFRRCQEEGILFTRGRPAEITDKPRSPEEAGKLMVVGEDTLIGRPYRVAVDMVILCAAMEARKDAPEIARILGISQGRDGFFLEEHPKLGPLNTATDGIFVAGACQSPKDIPDTVAQASGAAAKALALACRGRVEIPSAIAWIDPDVCAGCRTCIGLCPYGAIAFDAGRCVSRVNEALCKGCGSCAGVCPSGAAQVRHFRKRQVMAEFDGIVEALWSVELETAKEG